ncbi:hypothetical protein [Shivajiella indica]|uniref:N-acetyltransferase domain-containing protein n=1 Tax=Shivajiella indica TaxID=872115 RepID=A0ABW5BCS8_9BACT
MSDSISSDDILYILNNPWKLTESEWGLKENNFIDFYSTYIKNKLDTSNQDGFSKIWKTSNGQAIAILGFYKVGEKKYETFFVASHHMDEFGLKISFDLRNILKEKTLNYPGCTCGLYSASDHPKQIPWFKFIGFNYVPEENRGKQRYFEYVSS